MTAEPDLLPLPEPTRWCITGAEQQAMLCEWATNYARANVAHATAALQAEIEALRAEVEMLRDAFSDDDMTAGAHWFGRYVEQKRRAERLAEALRGLKDLMLGQVKWKPCDCGCPQQRTPDGPHSVTWLRAVQQVEIAISKAEGKE